MRKSPKFNSQDTRILFSSDFHAFHKREFIWQDRGFKSIWEHAKWIRDEINDAASDGKPTMVINLGDMFLNATAEEAKAYLHGFAKNVHFLYVWGNHESAMYRIYREKIRECHDVVLNEDQEVYPAQANNVTFLGYQTFVEIDKTHIFLNHFSPEIWDGMQHGFPCAFGHSHGSLKSGQRDALEQKKVDVGVDNCIAWFKKPYMTLEQFKEIINRKNTTVLDHHHKGVDSSFVCSHPPS